MIIEHMWLVEVIASKWARGDWQRREEFIAAGNEWLVKAAQNFDDSRDSTFETYAAHYIKAGIRECIRECDGVTILPQRVFALKPKVDALLEEGKSVEAIARILKCAVSMVVAIKHIAKGIVDSDAILSIGTDGPERQYVAKRTLADVKAKLTRRGWFILMERADGKTRQEIGNNLGCSHQAIREYEEKQRANLKSI